MILEGQHAKLVPLALHHLEDFQVATRDGNLEKLRYTMIPNAAGMEAEIIRRLGPQDNGHMLPFSIQLPDGNSVGQTTFMNIDVANRQLETGSTWLRASAQRGQVNTECKLMLLSHAFEALDFIAVKFRKHFMNHQLRRAIERLGAKLDGVLRSHMIMENKTLRDTAVYSIFAHEWPTLRASLRYKLGL